MSRSSLAKAKKSARTTDRAQLCGLAQVAALRQRWDLVRDLVAEGITNRRDLGDLAWRAAYAGRQELVEWLIDRGADNLEACAEMAAYGGQNETLKSLVALGAGNLDACACRAAHMGHLTAVQSLMDCGAPRPAAYGSCAVEGGHPEIQQWLESHFAAEILLERFHETLSPGDVVRDLADYLGMKGQPQASRILQDTARELVRMGDRPTRPDQRQSASAER